MRAFCFGLLFATGAAFAAERVDVGAFSTGDLSGWDAKAFQGTTEYRLVEDDARRVLKAESRAAASGRFKKVRIDLMRTPYLHWSWRVERPLAGLDEKTKAGDDYAARVYVVVAGTFFWNTRAVNYVWAGTQPEGSTWPNAFTGNAHMVALRSGNARAGTWVHERRDVRDDFKRLFGKDVRVIDAVALMTDTDNSGGTATAYYGDIYFADD
jgi:hypothetical protein